MEPTSFLDYGAFGLLAFLVFASVWALRAVWKYLTAEKGPFERFLGANAAFIEQQGECNRALIKTQGETSTSVEQLRKAGRRAAGVAREIADKLGLSEQAKTSLREVEEELAD